MNLIASVLHLDRQAIKALRITDPYSLHRVVYSLYTDIRSDQDKAASQPSGILYADQGGDFHTRKILLLANRHPDQSVDGQYGRVQSKPIAPDFLDHDHYRFQVIINPTRRDNASRKLLPMRTREAVADWFCERAQKNWGFTVDRTHFQVDRLDVQQFNAQQQHSVTLSQAHVQGQLRVTDHSIFKTSFTQGIGRGRAFGCGLLQIVPLFDNPFA